MIKKHVHIIKMGGTIEFIDPAYDAMNKKLMKLDTTIESYLKNVIQPHFNFSVEIVTRKDSRDINDEDRKKLVEAINSTPHANIMITHGTFTMKQTAEFLERIKLPDKKVILTGSMIPITGFTVSDAGFNLGFAIASFSTINAGVHISINGGLFTSGDVDKNADLLRFE